MIGRLTNSVWVTDLMIHTHTHKHTQTPIHTPTHTHTHTHTHYMNNWFHHFLRLSIYVSGLFLPISLCLCLSICLYLSVSITSLSTSMVLPLATLPCYPSTPFALCDTSPIYPEGGKTAIIQQQGP